MDSDIGKGREGSKKVSLRVRGKEKEGKGKMRDAEDVTLKG